MQCFHAIFHTWGRWGAPEAYNKQDGTATTVQRRECLRCGAVGYRRVLLETRG